MNGTTAYVLARKYVKDTANKLGAVKGAPCKIKSINKTNEFYIVIFEWKDEAGVSHTSELKMDNLGTLVEANPAEDATEKLQKLKIGDTVYSIPKDVIEISYAEYQALTEEERNDGQVRYVYDFPYEEEGGVGGSLENDIVTNTAVGGIKSGTVYESGTTLEQILKELLCPTLTPTLTSPSASLAGTGDKLLEKGTVLSATLTATFDRGSINPKYGTSGYRAGEATGYSLNGATAQAGNTWNVSVSQSNKTFTATITYGDGEQPKDSEGKNFNSPLTAGYITTNTVSYDFVEALWGNTNAITTIEKLPLIAKSTKQKDFVFPAQSVLFPEVFDIPASWNVTAVQVKNDLSGAFEDASSQFTITDVTHPDAAGVDTAYKRYTFNMGFNTGSRTVRVKWN